MLGSWLIWLLSIASLGLAMEANQTADLQARWDGLHQRVTSIEHLHGVAVLWVLLFVVLQLSSPLLMAFTLRAVYRLRTAVCFTVAAGGAMVLDALGLFGMLMWLRFSLGTG